MSAAASPAGNAKANVLAGASAHTLAAQGTVSAQGVAAAATGTVSFTDGTAPLGTVTLSNGIATFAAAFATPGNHVITSSYSGDAETAAANVTITQAVDAAGPAVPAPTLSAWMLALLGTLLGGIAAARAQRR